MITQELLDALIQERLTEVAQLQLEHQARALQRPSAPTGRAPSNTGGRRLPLLSIVARAFRLAEVRSVVRGN